MSTCTTLKRIVEFQKTIRVGVHHQFSLGLKVGGILPHGPNHPISRCELAVGFGEGTANPKVVFLEHDQNSILVKGSVIHVRLPAIAVR